MSNYFENIRLIEVDDEQPGQEWHVPGKKNLVPVPGALGAGPWNELLMLDLQTREAFAVRLPGSAHEGEKLWSEQFSMRFNDYERCDWSRSIGGPNAFGCSLRGGSAGVAACGGHVGVAHCTDAHCTDVRCPHYLVLWYLDWPAREMQLYPLCGVHDHQIVDATTLHYTGGPHRSNRWMLLTAESQAAWFTPAGTPIPGGLTQEYFNGVYTSP